MLKAIWYDTITDIEEVTWETIFPPEILKSVLLFKSMEDSFVNIIKYHYLCVYDNENIIAILPCFEFQLELDVVAPHHIQLTVKNIRKLWKRFFSVKTFVIGSYIATVEEYIGIKIGLSNDIHSFITSQIKNKTIELKCKIDMIKEVPDSQIERVKQIFNDFIFVDSLPNSYVPVANNFSPYPFLLKAKARQRFNRAKRDFIKNELKFEIVEDFANYSAIACELYTNVLNKSHSKFESLNTCFFENVSKNIGSKSYLLLVRDKK